MVYETRPWSKVYEKDGFPSSLAPYPEIPLFKFLDDSARQFPERPACTFLGQQYTYQEIKYQTDCFARALWELGVRKGDMVATILPNSPQFIIADYGILKCGATNVPCSLLHTERDLEYELGEAGVKTIICLDTHLELVKRVGEKVGIKNIIITNLQDYAEKEILPHPVPGTYQFRDLIAENEPHPPEVEINPREDLAEVPFTGGATGLPKGVMLTHYNLTCNVIQTYGLMKQMDIGFLIVGYASVLLALPFFHQYGHWAMHCAVYMSWNMLLVPDPRDVDMMAELMKKYRPLYNIAVPTQFMKLLNKIDEKVGTISASGSAALPPEVADKFEEKAGGPVDEGYGLTECSPVSHINLGGMTSLFKRDDEMAKLPPWVLEVIRMVQKIVGGERLIKGFTRLIPLLKEQAKKRAQKTGLAPKKRGSIGVPIPDTDVKIVDEDGNEVPVGETGEMWIKGPQVMKGYWPEPGKGLIDGWLPTGDIARMDEEGYFYIVDRVKDMINVSGYKVYSRIIDDVLYQIPGVEMACAIGIPDPERPGSERIKVFIKPRPEYKDKLSEEQIIEHCRKNLPPYAVPKMVEFRDDLPLTVTEKIFKRKLREEEIEKMKKAGIFK